MKLYAIIVAKGVIVGEKTVEDSMKGCAGFRKKMKYVQYLFCVKD